MNYHPIIAEAEAQGIVDVTAFLRAELPKRWMAEYKGATPRKTNILDIKIGTFTYMFDFVTELENEGILVPDIVREDRLVAGHGFSTADVVAGRNAGRMRGWIGPTERYLGKGRDKGHVFRCSQVPPVSPSASRENLFKQRAYARGRDKLFSEAHLRARAGQFC